MSSGLFVVGEHFQRVEHCLLGLKGVALTQIKRAHSHTVALGQVRRVLKELKLSGKASGDSDIAVLYVFGVGMRTHTGVARKMFGALAEKGINIMMITTSEVCVSVVVELGRGEEALGCLKKAFQV